ncbi:MAG: PHP domain-containing protein [Bacillota bacterium]
MKSAARHTIAEYENWTRENMKYACDLHIHSALSPCAENDMTPNNIVNMAVLKGLDIIAVTDHNSGANLEAVARCAKKKVLLFVPGMEVETAEEVHLVCLLPDTEKAHEFQRYVEATLPDMANREDIFGRQVILDENDEIIGEEKQMLATAANLTVEKTHQLIRKLGGAMIPAHVDRPSYSILSNLGIIPEHLSFTQLEVSKNCDLQAFRADKPELDRYKLIRSSDAHCLGDILERETFLELDNLSVRAVLDIFCGT